jgi:hypothetical protein
MELVLSAIYGIAAAFSAFGLVAGLHAVGWKIPNWMPVNCPFCMSVWFGCVMLLVHHCGNIIAYGSLVGATSVFTTTFPMLFQDTSKKEDLTPVPLVVSPLVENLANPLPAKTEIVPDLVHGRTRLPSAPNRGVPLPEVDARGATTPQTDFGAPENPENRGGAGAELCSQCSGIQALGASNDLVGRKHETMVESAR